MFKSDEVNILIENLENYEDLIPKVEKQVIVEQGFEDFSNNIIDNNNNHNNFFKNNDKHD
jgi:hypothetical protein